MAQHTIIIISDMFIKKVGVREELFSNDPIPNVYSLNEPSDDDSEIDKEPGSIEEQDEADFFSDGDESPGNFRELPIRSRQNYNLRPVSDNSVSSTNETNYSEVVSDSILDSIPSSSSNKRTTQANDKAQDITSNEYQQNSQTNNGSKSVVETTSPHKSKNKTIEKVPIVLLTKIQIPGTSQILPPHSLEMCENSEGHGQDSFNMSFPPIHLLEENLPLPIAKSYNNFQESDITHVFFEYIDDNIIESIVIAPPGKKFMKPIIDSFEENSEEIANEVAGVKNQQSEGFVLLSDNEKASEIKAKSATNCSKSKTIVLNSTNSLPEAEPQTDVNKETLPPPNNANNQEVDEDVCTQYTQTTQVFLFEENQRVDSQNGEVIQEETQNSIAICLRELGESSTRRRRHTDEENSQYPLDSNISPLKKLQISEIDPNTIHSFNIKCNISNVILINNQLNELCMRIEDGSCTKFEFKRLIFTDDENIDESVKVRPKNSPFIEILVRELYNIDKVRILSQDGQTVVLKEIKIKWDETLCVFYFEFDANESDAIIYTKDDEMEKFLLMNKDEPKLKKQRLDNEESEARVNLPDQDMESSSILSEEMSGSPDVLESASKRIVFLKSEPIDQVDEINNSQDLGSLASDWSNVPEVPSNSERSEGSPSPFGDEENNDEYLDADSEQAMVSSSVAQSHSQSSLEIYHDARSSSSQFDELPVVVASPESFEKNSEVSRVLTRSASGSSKPKTKYDGSGSDDITAIYAARRLRKMKK